MRLDFARTAILTSIILSLVATARAEGPEDPACMASYVFPDPGSDPNGPYLGTEITNFCPPDSPRDPDPAAPQDGNSDPESPFQPPSMYNGPPTPTGNQFPSMMQSMLFDGRSTLGFLNQSNATFNANFDSYHMSASGPYGPTAKRQNPNAMKGGGDPVSSDGEFIIQETDLSVPGYYLDYQFTRTYRNGVQFASALGNSWDHNYDQRLFGRAPGIANCNSDITYSDGQLNTLTFHQSTATNGLSCGAENGCTLYLPSSPIPMQYSLQHQNLWVTDHHVRQWALTDQNTGIVLYFSDDGYLQSIVHPTGQAIQVNWYALEDGYGNVTGKRVSSVTDTTSRTFFYNYDSNGWLQCVSNTQNDCTTAPLVTFNVDNPTKHLWLVTKGHETNGDRYIYHSTVASTGQLTTPSILPYCHLLCDPKSTGPQCLNQNACNTFHTLCDPLIAANDHDTDHDIYETNCTSFCSNYCSVHCTGASGQSCTTCPASTCSTTCNEYRTTTLFHDQCVGWMSASYPFCYQGGDTTNCLSNCVSLYTPKNLDTGATPYSFGDSAVLSNAIAYVYKADGSLVVTNTYGEDASLISFNRVTQQIWGTQTLTFKYHDLKLEAAESQYTPTPSVPDPAFVTPLSSLSSLNICSSCDSQPSNPYCHDAGLWRGCGDPTSEPAGTANPAQPFAYAVVINDLYGVVRTHYLDANFRVLRDINVSANEQTDYNYNDGASHAWDAVRRPAGDRTVTARDQALHPTAVTEYPAPGYLGQQTEKTTTISYGVLSPFGVLPVAGSLPIQIFVDTLGDNQESDYQYDSQNRVAEVDQYPSGVSEGIFQTIYSYDLIGGGTSPYPTTVTTPTGATKYVYGDWTNPGPTAITYDANGASPLREYRAYDPTWGKLTGQGLINRSNTTATYDASGRVYQVQRQIDPSSPWFTRTFTYGNDGDEPSVIDDPKQHQVLGFNIADEISTLSQSSNLPTDVSIDKRTCNDYGPDGRLLQTVHTQGNSIVYRYDNAGRVSNVYQGYDFPLPDGAVSCSDGWSVPAGDPGVLPILSLTYGLGGFVTSVTDHGVSKTVTTDGFGRVIEILDGVGNRERRGYDGRDRVIWVSKYSPNPGVPPYAAPIEGDPGRAATTVYTYDKLDRPLSATRWVPDEFPYATRISTTFQYLDATNQVVVTDPKGTRTFTRDGVGRLVQLTQYDGSTSITSYANNGTQSTTTTQTTFGNVVTERNYDGLGLLTTEIVNGQQSLFETHDIDGLPLVRTTLSEGTTTFTYDGLNRAATSSLTLTATDNAQTVFTYDGNDRLLSVQDPRGNTTSWVYDGLDRAMRHIDQLSRTETFTYDGSSTRLATGQYASGNSVTNIYDPLGQLVSETTVVFDSPLNVIRGFSYDALGQMLTASISGSGIDNTTSLTYNSEGFLIDQSNTLVPHNVHSMFLPDHSYKASSFGERTVIAIFDAFDRTTSLFIAGTTDSGYFDYNHGLGVGPATSFSDGTLMGSRTFDPQGRQVGLDVYNVFGGAVASYRDSYGPDGIVRARWHQILGQPPRTDVFGVDLAGRVTGESLGLANVGPFEAQVDPATIAPLLTSGSQWASYQLDHLANRTLRTDGNGAVASQYNQLNQLSPPPGGISNYDSADNQIEMPDRNASLRFDSFGHVSRGDANGTSLSYTYDALGRRILETRNGVTSYLVWDEGKIVEHGNDVDGYYVEIYGGDGGNTHVFSGTGSGAALIGFDYLTGGDGSVVGVVPGYTVGESYSYGAFGNANVFDANGVQQETSAFGNRFLYNGELLDWDTGTYAMGARNYDPQSGKFLSTDPIGVFGGLNTYSFTGGSPLAFSDPTGLKPNRLQQATACANDYTCVTNPEVRKILGPAPPTTKSLLVSGVFLAPVFVLLAPEISLSAGTYLSLRVPWLIPLVTHIAQSISGNPTENLVAGVRDIVRPGGGFLGSPGTSSKIRIVEGGLEEAEALFSQLSRGGKVVPKMTYPGTFVNLAEDASIGLRPVSTSGPPTIDIFIKGMGVREIKFIK